MSAVEVKAETKKTHAELISELTKIVNRMSPGFELTSPDNFVQYVLTNKGFVSEFDDSDIVKTLHACDESIDLEFRLDAIFIGLCMAFMTWQFDNPGKKMNLDSNMRDKKDKAMKEISCIINCYNKHFPSKQTL